MCALVQENLASDLPSKKLQINSITSCGTCSKWRENTRFVSCVVFCIFFVNFFFPKKHTAKQQRVTQKCPKNHSPPKCLPADRAATRDTTRNIMIRTMTFPSCCKRGTISNTTSAIIPRMWNPTLVNEVHFNVFCVFACHIRPSNGPVDHSWLNACIFHLVRLLRSVQNWWQSAWHGTRNLACLGPGTPNHEH